MDLRPPTRGPLAVGGPGGVVDADQAGNGEQCLASDASAQFGRVRRVDVVTLSGQMASDVAVESSCCSAVTGKPRRGRVEIRSGKMDAVVVQEHPAAVRLV